MSTEKKKAPKRKPVEKKGRKSLTITRDKDQKRIEYKGRPATLHLDGQIHRLKKGAIITVPPEIAADLLVNKRKWKKAAPEDVAEQSGKTAAGGGE